MLLIGSHVSFNKDKQLLGSVLETISYGSNTFMFYTGAPQNTMRYPIDDELTKKAIDLMKENKVDYSKVLVHAPYIINIANNGDDEKYNFSINFLKGELIRCEKLGIKYLILHPGSHVGLGKEEGIKSIVFALNKVLDASSTMILLESMAGKGTEIGSTFQELKMIIDGVLAKDKIGICLDTCHLNDSGYDISNFDYVLDELDRVIGLKYLKCLHVNDSKNIPGSHKDRHENIGFGNLGFDNLIKIIYNDRIKDIPKILETPYVLDNPPYKYEIEMIKNKKFNPNLKDKINS